MSMETILQAGGKAARNIGLAVLLSCTPAVRAQRDYDLYPGRKAELAMRNMQQIAAQICGPPTEFGRKAYPYCYQMSFSEQGITYAEKDCDARRPATYGGVSMMECTSETFQTYSLAWDDLRKIIPGYNSVKVCLEGKKCTTINGFKSREQADDFAEALNIYVTD